MKIIIVISIILVTMVIIFLKYKKDQDRLKMGKYIMMLGIILIFMLFIILARPVPYILFPYLLLILISWGSLIWYIFKDKYHLALHMSPISIIILYILSSSADILSF
jgi:hypothetical protein